MLLECGARQRRARARPGVRFRRSAHARRLPCDARSCGLPRNSLRSLRSLRSDSRGKSDHEARCARGREPCAARRRPFAPGPTRPQPCGQQRRVFECSQHNTVIRARGWCPAGAHGRRRAAQWREGKPGVLAGPARSHEVGAAFSGAHGGIAAALSERAAERGRGQSGGLSAASRGAGPLARCGLQGQRTLAAGEGGDG